jgi:phosphatidylglycerol---prolipoprotein diacylglyceryl transferase
MHPVAFQIFGLEIRWYGILITLGIVSAFAFAWNRAKLYGLSRDNLMDLGLVIIIVGILGARLLYVLANLNYFLANPGDIIQLQMQGLAFLGIIIFNIPAVIIFAKVKRLSFWRICDLAAPSIAIGYFFGRIGCFLNGCCYGPESSVCSVMMNGVSRFPTQLVNAVVAALIFLALWWLSREKKLRMGELFVYLIYFYAITHFGTEFLRADAGHNPVWGTPLNLAQWGNILLLLATGAMHYFVRKINEPSQVSEEEILRIEEIDRNTGAKQTKSNELDGNTNSLDAINDPDGDNEENE